MREWHDHPLVPDVVRDCVAAGLHLMDADDDGFCNFCGHQESELWDEFAPVEDDWWNRPVSPLLVFIVAMAVWVFFLWIALGLR
jgi:hypothetical protein